MTKERAIERYKDEITRKFNDYLGVFPFWVISNHTYKRWQEGKSEHEKFAHDILFRAERIGGMRPGLSSILDSFEKFYEEDPYLSRKALQVILDCPPETGWQGESYLSYCDRKKAAALKGLHIEPFGAQPVEPFTYPYQNKEQ